MLGNISLLPADDVMKFHLQKSQVTLKCFNEFAYRKENQISFSKF